MKIAAYGVGKNEESNIAGWYEGIKDADYILYLDTGSTDKTIEIAKSFGINVFHASFNPWDETNAKNTALSLIPLEYDYCINLDIDQHMITKDWKEKVLFNNNDRDILVCDLESSEGLDDGNVIKKLFRIHKRTGLYWFGYRPEIKKYGRYVEEPSHTFLDVLVKDMPGDYERFENRETLYVESFMNYVGKIKRYRHNQTLLSGLISLALAYYEKNDKENFMQIYKELNDFTDSVESSLSIEIPDQFLINLAYSLFNPHDAYLTYKKLYDSEHTSEYQKTFLTLREAIVYFKTKKYDKIGNLINKIDNNANFFEGNKKNWNSYYLSGIELHLIEKLKEFVNFKDYSKVSDQIFKDLDYLSLAVFSNIGYGKRHDELAIDSFNYFMEHRYE